MRSLGRRSAIVGGAGAALGASAHVGPAQARDRRVGLLLPAESADSALLVETFRAALTARAGSNIALTVRTLASASDAERLLAEDIDVAVGASAPEVLALRRARRGKPIVMVAVGDPVGAGLAASLARPGADVTGLSDFRSDFPAERLRLVRELVFGARKIAFLHNPDAPTARLTFDAARDLGVDLVPLAARTGPELQQALAALSADAAEALLVVPNPLTFQARGAIAARTFELARPLFFGYADFMDIPGDRGALASYGADLRELWGRAADYVWRILNGAHPADMPIGQPDRGQLVINLAVASRLRLDVPDALLGRADRVLR